MSFIVIIIIIINTILPDCLIDNLAASPDADGDFDAIEAIILTLIVSNGCPNIHSPTPAENPAKKCFKSDGIWKWFTCSCEKSSCCFNNDWNPAWNGNCIGGNVKGVAIPSHNL